MNRYFELFLITGVAWTILVIVKFAFSQNRNSPEAPYVLLVILVSFLTILDNLLRPSIIPMRYLDFIYPLTRLSYYLVGPVLLIYTQKLIEEDFKLKPKHLLHLIPFIMMFVYIIIDPQSMHPEQPFGIEGEINRIRNLTPIYSMRFIWLLSKNISRLTYSIIILYLIRKNYSLLPDRVSYINRKNSLSWLKAVIICYTGIYLADTIIQLIVQNSLFFAEISAAVGRNLPPVLFIFFFSLFSDRQPVIAIPEENKDSRKAGSLKYEKSGITENDSKKIYSDLSNFLQDTKAYLEPDLTLQLLSEQIGVSRHKLSEAINREADMRFYSFINGFRLKEFEDSIKTDRYPDYTILAIAFECGFKSSSGFYSMVRKEYDITPKYLVKNILKSSR